MKAVVEQVLKGHELYPALAVDRHWNMVAANAAVALLTQLAAPELFEPPVNVLRVALHPKGLAPHIVNRGEWRAHLLERLDHRSEEHTSELQSLMRISYAVFCLKKKKNNTYKQIQSTNTQ